MAEIRSESTLVGLAMALGGGDVGELSAPERALIKQLLLASGCRQKVPFSEPLIPTNLTDLQMFPDEASVKRYVDDLAKRQVPVKLMLPIEKDGVRSDYTFTFVLKPRWGDATKQ